MNKIQKQRKLKKRQYHTKANIDQEAKLDKIANDVKEGKVKKPNQTFKQGATVVAHQTDRKMIRREIKEMIKSNRRIENMERWHDTYYDFIYLNDEEAKIYTDYKMRRSQAFEINRKKEEAKK